MNELIEKCLKMAEKNSRKGEIPVAAMIIKNGKIISKAANNKNLKNNILGHAEIICIQKANKKMHRWNLNDCEMIVTLKPCELCQLVIRESRIKKVYYVAEKTDNKKIYNKTKFEILNCNKQQEYIENLSSFFANKR